MSTVWALYRREVRSALRERSVVVNSVLLPVLLYPALLWVEISALAFVSGLSERTPSRVGIVEPTAEHAPLLDSLEARNVEIHRVSSIDEGLEALAAGELQAVVTLAPTPGGGGPSRGVRAEVHYDRAVDASRRALDRVERGVGAYRDARLAELADAFGVGTPQLDPFRVELRNVSSERDVGAAMLSLMIPMFLVVAVALGCLVPAVDTSAGERERGTWETLLSTGAARRDVLLSKYLYVASFGAAAGVLNATAMTLVIGPIMAPLAASRGGDLVLSAALSPTTWAVMVVGSAALALLFAALMMLLASFARTFKDGQAMVTPVFYLALLPFLLGQQSDRTLTPVLAAIPVANVAMMIRDAIRGVFLWPLVLETLVVSALLVAVCLWAAKRAVTYEDFVLGSHEGGPWRFVRTRLLPGAARRRGGTRSSA